MSTLHEVKTWIAEELPRLIQEPYSSEVISSAMLHPHTFRYRLRRVAEVGAINLADPEKRFVAMLHLRVLGPGFELEG